MPATLIADLLPLAADTIVAQPGTLDGFGAFIASGSSVPLTCHIEGESKLVRDNNGREVTSSMQVFIVDASAPSLSVEGHRYTLPSRFIPSADLIALTIGKATDENGAHHEVVMFP